MSTARAPALILQNQNLGIHHKRSAAKGLSDGLSKPVQKKGAGGLGSRKALQDISNSSTIRQEKETLRKKNKKKEEFNFAEEMFLHDHNRCVEVRKAEMNRHIMDTLLFEHGLLYPTATSPKSKQAEVGIASSPPRYLEIEPVPELQMHEIPELCHSPIQWDSPPPSPSRYELPELDLAKDDMDRSHATTGKVKSELSVILSKSSTLAPHVKNTHTEVQLQGHLYLDYYKESCPLVEEIVRRNVEIAVLKEPRMAASLLRLHFHDCFVMGCDASLLLDSTGDIISEKLAGPNLNSLRGFEVIDEIKAILEEACPYTVSCADLLAIVARDAVELRGGPSWPVGLGRRDSLKASLAGANQYIPTPNSSLQALILNFAAQGLDAGDLVALSGSHTIGKSRCLSFKPRIYNENLDEETNYHYKRNTMFRRILRSICPQSGRDNAVVPLDLLTPAKFDNQYYRNIIQGKGLLQSDNVLLSQDVDGKLRKQVWAYASDQQYYFSSFVASMIKMGNINLLTGEQGEIRRNCRFVNNW